MSGPPWTLRELYWSGAEFSGGAAVFGDGDEFGDRDFAADNPSVTVCQSLEIGLEEVHQFRGRGQLQIFLDVPFHQAVVFFLTGRMSVVTPFKAADVSIEMWTDVIQFVQNRNHFFPEGVILKAGQVERQQVQHFCFADINPLHRPGAPPQFFGQCSLFKTEGSQLGLNSVDSPGAGLGKGNSDPVHADVLKHFEPVTNITAQQCHGRGEIEVV